MNIAPFLLLLSVPFLIPVSDVLPTLDVTSSCKAAADVNVADTQSYSACMNDENTARKQLQEIWHSFAAAERTRCTAEAKSGGIESYVDLLVCLQLASDADAAAKIQLRGARRK